MLHGKIDNAHLKSMDLKKVFNYLDSALYFYNSFMSLLNRPCLQEIFTNCEEGKIST